MPKYDELTTRLGRFLLGDKRRGTPALIDPWEQGKRDHEGIPKPINLKWQFANRKVGRPKRFTRTHVAQHLSGDGVWYYRSNRVGGRALLMVDIDAHAGETDAQHVAERIARNHLPGAYYEPSTNGRGRHLYAVLAFSPYAPRRMVNHHLKCVGIALRELMKAEGHQSRIDHLPLRTFSEWGKDAAGKWGPIKMGHLAKLPRPRTLDDMIRLEDAPVYTTEDTRQIVLDYKRLRERLTGRPAPAAETPPPVDPPVPVEARRRPTGAFRGMDECDPRSRAVHCVLNLARSLGRLPTLDEARSFYLSSGLATIRPSGDGARDLSRRDRRLEGAIAHVGRTFDESKLGRGYSPDVLLPLIRSNVEPHHREGTKYPYRVTEEDLAVALHVVECASFERKGDRNQQWTCPNARIIGAFRKLASEGRLTTTGNAKGGCDRPKAVALKLILQRAGLVEVIDGSYRVGTRRRRRGGMTSEVLINNTCVGEFSTAPASSPPTDGSGVEG